MAYKGGTVLYTSWMPLWKNHSQCECVIQGTKEERLQREMGKKEKNINVVNKST